MSDGAAKPQTNGNHTQTRHTEMSLHTDTRQMEALTAGTVWNLFGRVWPKGLKSDLRAISCPFPASYQFLCISPSFSPRSTRLYTLPHFHSLVSPYEFSLLKASLITSPHLKIRWSPMPFTLPPWFPNSRGSPAQNLSLPSPEPILMSPLCWMKMVSQVRFPWMMGGSQECR